MFLAQSKEPMPFYFLELSSRSHVLYSSCISSRKCLHFLQRSATFRFRSVWRFARSLPRLLWKPPSSILYKVDLHTPCLWERAIGNKSHCEVREHWIHLRWRDRPSHRSENLMFMEFLFNQQCWKSLRVVEIIINTAILGLNLRHR